MLLHKFIDELSQLEKEQKFCGSSLQGVYNFLFIGTFEPDSNCGPLYNISDWFYGYKTNRFWYVLPMMIKKISLHQSERQVPKIELVNEWQKFCLQNKIVIVDLIKSVKTRGRLKDKTDTELNSKLIQSGGDYSLFNFRDAFKNVKFKTIVFTRSSWGAGMNIDVLTMIKKNAEKTLKKNLAPGGKMLSIHTTRNFDPTSNYTITKEALHDLWVRVLGYSVYN